MTNKETQFLPNSQEKQENFIQKLEDFIAMGTLAVAFGVPAGPIIYETIRQYDNEIKRVFDIIKKTILR